MVKKLARYFFQLVGAVFIFLAGILVGSTIYGSKRDSYVTYPSLSLTNIETNKELNSIKEQALKSFSFAYNTTHLWSLRLADQNYYHIARLLPCRTVNYVSASKNETLNSCNQSIIDEFSIETSIYAQKWIYEHQHPADCTNKKIAIIDQFAWSGFGSTIHQIAWAVGRALSQNRIAVYKTPGNWLYGTCPLGTPDCFFLPISNCSVPSTIDGEKTVRIQANLGLWKEPINPSIFQNRSFNWYRSQVLFYVMRFKPEILAHVQGAVAQYFNPPSIDLHRPYIAIYVRRSDKVQTKEMAQAYPLQQYFDLFDSDARRAKIKTVYINSEDENVFSEFDQLNKNKAAYYKLLRTDATRNIVFMSLIATRLEQRKKLILEFLTDLFIEANADLHSGTLTSNWCRIVDEIKFVLGKMVPYYTPENRYIID